jgi:hypothetical protein
LSLWRGACYFFLASAQPQKKNRKSHYKLWVEGVFSSENREEPKKEVEKGKGRGERGKGGKGEKGKGEKGFYLLPRRWSP